MNNVQTIAQRVGDLSDVGTWRRIGADVWHALKSAGMARAADHLAQVATRYDSLRPAFAEELRAASKFAKQVKFR